MGNVGLNPHGFSVSYYIFQTVNRLMAFAFFKKVHLLNVDKIPKSGPLIMCGTHSNMWLDANLLCCNVPREQYFTVAATTAKVKTLSTLMKLCNLVNFRRPLDEIYPGTGTITSVSSSQLKGNNTKFSTTLSEKSTIMIENPKCELLVTKILNDEALEISNSRDIKFDGEAEFRIMPKLDNKILFDACSRLMSEGKAIAIFPEGMSNDTLELLPLKPGVGYIYIGAVETYNSHPQLMACGINYEKRDGFRTEVVMNFGTPITFEDICKFGTNPSNPKLEVDQILMALTNMFSQTRISASTQEELDFIQLITRLFLSKNEMESKQLEFDTFKKIQNYVRKEENKHEVRWIKTEVDDYSTLLSEAKTSDDQLVSLKLGVFTNLGMFVCLTMCCLLASAFLLPGLIYMGPLGYALTYFAEKLRKTTLKRYTHKTTALDTKASWSVIWGTFAIPSYWILTSIVFFFTCAGRLSASHFGRGLLSVLCFFGLAFYMAAWLLVLDFFNSAFPRCKTNLRALIYPATFRSLSSGRLILSQRIGQFFE